MKSLISRKFFAAMSVLAGLALSTNTWATVAFYSTPFSVTDVSSGPVGDSFSGTLSDVQFLELPRFDPTLGTLEDVEIQFQSDYVVFMLLQAFDGRPEATFIPVPPFVINAHNDAGIDVSVEGSLRVQLFDPSSSTTTLNFPSVNGFCYELISDAVDASCLDNVFSPSTYDALMPLGALGLLDFVGTDPINLLTALNGTFSGVCDSDDVGDECELGVRITWSGLVGVTYTYGIDGGGDPPGGGDDGNSVPEPTTLVLFGLAGLGLALSRRRSKALG